MRCWPSKARNFLIRVLTPCGVCPVLKGNIGVLLIQRPLNTL
jgi:hypothetical protein